MGNFLLSHESGIILANRKTNPLINSLLSIKCIREEEEAKTLGHY